MAKDKENKKSLWDMFFGVLEDEEEHLSSEEEEEDEDESLTSVLEGKEKKGKKIVPVFDDAEEISIEGEGVELNKETEEINDTEESNAEEDESFEEERVENTKEKEIEEVEEEDRPLNKDTERLFKAPTEHYFFIYEGPTIKDLYDLEYYLGTITENQFRHHVRDDGNDFANWVRAILKEEDLASALERAGDRDTMCSILSNFLNSS